MIYRYIILLSALTLFLPYTVWYMATPGVFAVHAFVSTVPARRYHETPLCQAFWPSDVDVQDGKLVARYDTLISLEIRNGTCPERLWGFIPKSRPITRPSSHAYTKLKHAEGKVYVSAFSREDNNYQQFFWINTARDQGNITISIIATGPKDAVSFSCDSIEVKSVSGILGLFSNPNGGKYSAQLLSADDSSDTITVKAKNNERLTYNADDVLLEVTLDPIQQTRPSIGSYIVALVRSRHPWKDILLGLLTRFS